MEGAVVSHNWAHDSPKAGFRFDSSPGRLGDDVEDVNDDGDDGDDDDGCVWSGWGKAVIRATMWLGILALGSW